MTSLTPYLAKNRPKMSKIAIKSVKMIVFISNLVWDEKPDYDVRISKFVDLGPFRDWN